MKSGLTLREELALGAYHGAINVALPLGILLGLPFLMLKAKRRATLFRRLGFQSLPEFHPRRKPLWIHALSLGETLSAVSLVKALHARIGERPVVFSTSTLSGRQIAEQRLGGCVERFCYFPYDLVPSVGRALRMIDPAMAVFIETDIWPGVQSAIRHEGFPAWLVNARLSPRTLRSCTCFNALFRPALNSFEAIVPQSAAEAGRYQSVGVISEKLRPPGNLKFDVAVGELPDADRQQLAMSCGLQTDDRVWIAGSTHPGEEELVCEVFQKVSRKFPALRLILVPRNPQRVDEVCALCARAGLSHRRFSETNRATQNANQPKVVVVDVMGKLASLYHLAEIALVGGSFIPKGGQSPIEPAAAGRPVLFGPHMSAFPDVAAELVRVGGAFQLADAAALETKLVELLSQPEAARAAGERGRTFVGSHRGTTGRLADAIADRVRDLP